MVVRRFVALVLVLLVGVAIDVTCRRGHTSYDMPKLPAPPILNRRRPAAPGQLFVATPVDAGAVLVLNSES